MAFRARNVIGTFEKWAPGQFRHQWIKLFEKWVRVMSDSATTSNDKSWVTGRTTRLGRLYLLKGLEIPFRFMSQGHLLNNQFFQNLTKLYVVSDNCLTQESFRKQKV